jgi:hypothetical protein
VEAHNDEAGGNEDPEEEEEDSDNPEIGGLEFIVAVSTDLCAFLVSADVVIAHFLELKIVMYNHNIC